MLKAILREHLNNQELSQRKIALNPSNTPITIGRSENCTYQIGTGFGELAQWIARTQATIDTDGEDIKLFDGTRARVSTNGVWAHTGKIDGSITLYPGLQLTLFKADTARTTLEVFDSDSNGNSDGVHDTYTGEDLLERLQAQVGLLQEQTQRMQEQVVLLAGQLAQREAIDEHQEQTIAQMSKTTKRILSSILGLTAALILGSGYAKDLSAADRQQWISLLLSVALGGSAVYVQKAKETDTTSVKP